jgi:hypothetical protein
LNREPLNREPLNRERAVRSVIRMGVLELF